MGSGSEVLLHNRCLQIMNSDEELMLRAKVLTHLTKASTFLLSRPVGSPCSLSLDCQVCQEDPPEPVLSTNQRPRPKQGGL